MIEIEDLGLTQFGNVGAVEAVNMLLDFVDHRRPVVFLLLVNLPSLEVLVSTCLSEESSVVHHLLGDATHIDASATKAPSGSYG